MLNIDVTLFKTGSGVLFCELLRIFRPYSASYRVIQFLLPSFGILY